MLASAMENERPQKKKSGHSRPTFRGRLRKMSTAAHLPQGCPVSKATERPANPPRLTHLRRECATVGTAITRHAPTCSSADDVRSGQGEEPRHGDALGPPGCWAGGKAGGPARE